MGIKLMDFAVDRNFKKPNTKRGVENKQAVLTKTGIKPETVKGIAPKYIMIGGVPYKMCNGVAKPMIKK